MKRILFIDRDGTLVKEPLDYQVDELQKITLCEGVIEALLKLKKAGFLFVMVSNQDGLGTSSFSLSSFQMCQDFILKLFSSQGIDFDEIFICPHTEKDECLCRKPKIGLLEDFLKNTAIDKAQSWVIGDRETDKVLAKNLNISYLPISDTYGWKDVTNAIFSSLRSANLSRKTKETEIELSIALDSDSPSNIETPISFFTHMLEQVAHHGGFYLKLNAKGDVAVDDHHLIEDTAITLGQAIKQALGSKEGIKRYGFMCPMDESLASIAIDLSGRSFCSFKAPFTREFVGGMATEMVSHFFKSLAFSLEASVHVSVEGENHHHMIEACFKALGRALKEAIRYEGGILPSTKGVL